MSDPLGQLADSTRHLCGQIFQAAIERHAGADERPNLVAERGELIERDRLGAERGRNGHEQAVEEYCPEQSLILTGRRRHFIAEPKNPPDFRRISLSHRYGIARPRKNGCHAGGDRNASQLGRMTALQNGLIQLTHKRRQRLGQH